MMGMVLIYGVSIVFAPWWVVVAITITLLVRWNAWFLVVVGGLVADMLYGVPIGALYGFSHIYTVYAVSLSLASVYLRDTIIE